MTQPATHTLPDTLADLLEVAVNDMNSLDRDRYLPNSLMWHSGTDREDSVCEVCLGGAALAGSLGMDRSTPNGTADTIIRFGLNGNKIRALDALRCGDIRTAAYTLNWHPDSIALAQAFEQREEMWELRSDLAAVSSFYTWEHWDNAEPRYRRLIDLLRTHNL